MKKVCRDFIASIEVPDYVGVDDVEIVVTAEASYGEQTPNPLVVAGEPYVLEPEPPPKPPLPKCPKCGQEIEQLTVNWPATVAGMAELVGNNLDIDINDSINEPRDILQDGEGVYCCPECSEELFKAGEEDKVIEFLKGGA